MKIVATEITDKKWELNPLILDTMEHSTRYLITMLDYLRDALIEETDKTVIVDSCDNIHTDETLLTMLDTLQHIENLIIPEA